jgi:hypothetical protein
MKSYAIKTITKSGCRIELSANSEVENIDMRIIDGRKKAEELAYAAEFLADNINETGLARMAIDREDNPIRRASRKALIALWS